jgi:hypothetical protein
MWGLIQSELWRKLLTRKYQLMDEEIPPPPVMRPMGQEQRTSLGRLHNTPVVPLMSKNMPQSMRQLVMEYEHYGGSRYEQASTHRGWATSLNLAYSRWKYLYTQLILRVIALRKTTPLIVKR